MKYNDLPPAILYPAIPPQVPIQFKNSCFVSNDLSAIRVSGVSINSVGVVSIDQSDHRTGFSHEYTQAAIDRCVSATGNWQ